MGGALAVGLAASAWFGSGAWLKRDSQQNAANRFAEFKRCMLGDGLSASDLPSVRLTAIERNQSKGDWPQRCQPYAEHLDAALARPSLRDEWGQFPGAAAIVSNPQQRGQQMDRLWKAVEAVDLPTATPASDVPPAPDPVEIRVAPRQLTHPLGRVVELDDVAVDRDPVTGRVARLLLLGPQPNLCHLNDGPIDQRWRSAACRPLGLKFSPGAAVRLARSEPGAADLVYSRTESGSDGFYDVASGRRLWTPHFAGAQALVRESGATSILYATFERAGSERESTRLDTYRLVRFEPGKRPNNRRLKIPKNARVVMLPQALVYWHRAKDRDHDALYVQPLLEDHRLGKRRRVGDLPRASLFVDSCAGEHGAALLFAKPGEEPHYTLVVKREGQIREPIDVGFIGGQVDLTCTAHGAVISRNIDRQVATWDCDGDGCIAARSGDLPGLSSRRAIAAVLGDRLIYVRAVGSTVRVRVAKSETIANAPEQVLLESSDIRAMRLVSGSNLALLLLQDAQTDVHAIRIDRGGQAELVRLDK